MAIICCSIVLLALDDMNVYRERLQQAFEDRQTIRSGVVTVKGVYEADHLSAPREWTSTIWFDGVRCREDRVFKVADPGSQTEPKREVRCFDGQSLTYWESDEVKDAVGIAIHQWHGAEAEELRVKSPLRYPPDPRFAGLVTLNSLAFTFAYSPSDFWPLIPRNRLSTKKLEAASANGVVRFSFQDEYKTRWEVEFATDPATHLTRCLLVSDDESSSQLIECHYGEELQNGLRFPETVRIEAYAQGRLTLSEVCEYSVSSINEPIEDKIFSLAGLNIPAKNIASYPPQTGPQHWNGAEKKSGYRQVVNPTSPTRSQNFATYASLTLLLGVVLYLMARALKSDV